MVVVKNMYHINHVRKPGEEVAPETIEVMVRTLPTSISKHSRARY